MLCYIMLHYAVGCYTIVHDCKQTSTNKQSYKCLSACHITGHLYDCYISIGLYICFICMIVMLYNIYTYMIYILCI